MQKKVFIKTYGCQMNEYDSGRIYDSIKKIGYNKTENKSDINVNACSPPQRRDILSILFPGGLPKISTPNYSG